MKIMFVSDIHGSAYYMKKIIEKFNENEAEYLVILGDILYHGPRNPLPKEYDPKMVAKLLNEISEKVISIRGNCDSEVDQMMVDIPILADYSNLLIDGRRVFLTHGHKYSMDNHPKLKVKDIFAFGHIHIPVLEEKDGIVYFNPGSVSLPKESSKNSYGILDNETLKILSFDDEIVKIMKI